jgi:hypothetical protein
VDAARLLWGGGADWTAWVAGVGEKVWPEGRENGVDRAHVTDVGKLGPWDEVVLASFVKKGDGSTREGFLLFLL